MTLPQASVLAIGTELLKGSVVNTNAAFISKSMNAIGIGMQSHMVCHDRFEDIEECLSRALSCSDIVILTGGLGPTPDDVTRDALAHFFKVPLEISKTQVASIKKYYRSKKQKFPKMVEKEAMYPSNAKPLVNRHGIALGFYISCGSKLVIVLPGVPLELEKMIKEQVTPLLKRLFPRLKALPSLTVKIVGLSEPAVMTRLRRDFFTDDFEFGIYPEPGLITIRLYAHSRAVIGKLQHKIKARLGHHVYAYNDIPLAEAVGFRLGQLRKSVAVAESCTGGMLASRITSVPGASRYFSGGLTVYSNASKELLGVPKEDIKNYGAVSKQVAESLARNIQRKMDSSFGVGITGIAGPAGGSKSKPVGTVFISVKGKKTSNTKQYLFWGSRKQIQMKACAKALELLRRELYAEQRT